MSSQRKNYDSVRRFSILFTSAALFDTIGVVGEVTVLSTLVFDLLSIARRAHLILLLLYISCSSHDAITAKKGKDGLLFPASAPQQ